MKRVIVVQHEGSVPPGHIEEVLKADGVDHVVLEAWREPEWPAVADVGALVVLGGTMNVDELDAYPFLRRSRALMSDALEAGVPTLGVCLGSQMMARVLGAEVYRAEPRNAFFAPLESTEEGAEDPLVAPFADDLPVLQFHEDTFALPEEATLLATSSASGRNQAFRFGSSAYAIQFHFEVDRSIVRTWIDNIGPDAMRDEWGTEADELMRQVGVHIEEQAQRGRDLMRAFLRKFEFKAQPRSTALR
jgi:GMP synthase (glutamine-hydrolysing)